MIVWVANFNTQEVDLAFAMSPLLRGLETSSLRPQAGYKAWQALFETQIYPTTTTGFDLNRIFFAMSVLGCLAPIIEKEEEWNPQGNNISCSFLSKTQDWCACSQNSLSVDWLRRKLFPNLLLLLLSISTTWVARDNLFFFLSFFAFPLKKKPLWFSF